MEVGQVSNLFRKLYQSVRVTNASPTFQAESLEKNAPIPKAIFFIIFLMPSVLAQGSGVASIWTKATLLNRGNRKWKVEKSEEKPSGNHQI